MTKTLYLLRHGDTAANGRFIGSTDLPVSASGYPQLESTRMQLQTADINKIYCSPMLRCRQTAEFLQLSIEAIENSRLREIDFGSWEEKTFQEISRGWPDTVRDWSTWSEEFSFPEGEKIGSFLERIREVKSCIDESEEEKILIVTHGGVIRHLICLYLGLSPDKYLLFDVKAGCFATLALFSEGGVLMSLNCG